MQISYFCNCPHCIVPRDSDSYSNCGLCGRQEDTIIKVSLNCLLSNLCLLGKYIISLL